MIRFGISFVILCLGFLPLAHSAESGSGSSRNYETDILRDTFGFGPGDLDADMDSVFQGCPKRDCIPSIDQPQFLSPAEVDYLEDSDIVLSITIENVTRAYPTRILDHHEIVNDRFSDTPVAISYCPLCGSGLAFVRVLDDQEVEFGVSGLLRNNDLIMYDRKTNSLWQQITGQAIAGPRRGTKLKPVPVAMSLWADWKNMHPEGKVLALPGRAEHYRKVAYGDYASNDRLLFPVTSTDARLHIKKIIYGVETTNRPVAIEGDWLIREGHWQHEVDGQMLRLEVDAAGAVYGTMNGKPIPVHRMYWFAWYSFHPNTSLIDGR